MRLIVRGGNSDYQDLGLEVDDDDPTDSSSPLPARAHVCVFLRCLASSWKGSLRPTGPISRQGHSPRSRCTACSAGAGGNG
jgi:hypothetical protein